MPPFDILPLFSAGRSRKLTLVPIIQSLAQLEKNYGKEGAEIIGDNCQDTIFSGFAPNSQTAETLSKALGSRTVLTGSISKGKDSNSQSLQMAERALLSPDELKNLPKGDFIVMKTGTHPMRTKLQLYFKWGISFEEPYQVPERAQREVYYAGKEELLMNIKKSLYFQPQPVMTSKADAPRQGERPHFCCHQRHDTTAQLEGHTLAERQHRKKKSDCLKRKRPRPALSRSWSESFSERIAAE